MKHLVLLLLRLVINRGINDEDDSKFAMPRAAIAAQTFNMIPV